MDTGVRLSHKHFGGRAINFQLQDKSAFVNDFPADDVDGHGTHVASIAAAGNDGAAPWATIINVKTICSESESEKGCHSTNGGSAQALSEITDEVSGSTKHLFRFFPLAMNPRH